MLRVEKGTHWAVLLKRFCPGVFCTVCLSGYSISMDLVGWCVTFECCIGLARGLIFPLGFCSVLPLVWCWYICKWKIDVLHVELPGYWSWAERMKCAHSWHYFIIISILLITSVKSQQNKSNDACWAPTPRRSLRKPWTTESTRLIFYLILWISWKRWCGHVIPTRKNTSSGSLSFTAVFY